MKIIKIIYLCIVIITGLIVDNSQAFKNHRRIIRIANGKRLEQEHYPYVVGLKIESSNHTNYCTGTLISPLFVITAAHCVVGSKDTEVEVYQYDPRDKTGEKRSVVELFLHSLYNETTMVADLCLLKINKPFERVASYANISEQPEIFANNSVFQCNILGWGKNQLNNDPSFRANVASVSVKYGPDACMIPPDNDSIKNIVRRTWQLFLCPVPDNRMACEGDSGGPLMCQGLLFGITSHAYNYYPGMSYSKIKCGDNRVQTRHLCVWKYRPWVNHIINGTSSNTVNRNYLLLLLGVVVWWLGNAL